MAVAARREVVRQLQGLGLSERQALRLVGMSASRYVDDRMLALMALAGPAAGPGDAAVASVA